MAALVSTRVYSKLPAAKVWPAVRVARTAGGPIEETGGYLHDPLFQLDVFADDEARLLLATAPTPDTSAMAKKPRRPVSMSAAPARARAMATAAAIWA